MLLHYVSANGVDGSSQLPAEDGRRQKHVSANGPSLGGGQWRYRYGEDASKTWAPLEAKSVRGGTPLGAAIWAATESDPNDPIWPKVDWVPIVERLLEAGANVDVVEYPTGNSRIDAVLRRHCAEGRRSWRLSCDLVNGVQAGIVCDSHQ
jgi:hypothetical protein